MRVIYILVILFLQVYTCMYAQDWQFLGLGNEFIMAIAIDWSDPEIIYAGSGSNFSAGRVGGIFKSTNSGADWDTLIRGVTVRDLDLHPTNSKIIYAALSVNVLTQPGIIKSTDGGISWIKADSGMYISWEVGVGVLEIDPHNPEILYAGTGGPHGGNLYKSTNGAINWTSLNEPVLSSKTCIEIDPKNPAHIFFGTDDIGNLFESHDGGITWAKTALKEKGIIYDIKIDPYSSEIIYVGTSGPGFFMSTDGGLTWTQNNTGLRERVTVFRIQLLSSDNRSKIFINADASLGIFYLSDDLEWMQFGNVGSWFITLFENKIYAGSYKGIYVCDIVTSLDEIGTFPSSINLYQNYPNPFNANTQIKYEINREGNVSINVFDILGRKIKTLVSERKPQGIYTINWNGTDDYGKEVSSGLYICSLKKGSEFQQFKMVLTK